jgi:putative ABC transport system ATP-binding protein
MMAFIECRQVVKAYSVSGHEIVALRGIDFEMERGEMVAIIGPSGAGKSSLLNLLGGLDTPTAGQLIVDGQNLLALKGRHLTRYRLQQVGFIWQAVERNLFAHRSALRNVTLPMMLAGAPFWERTKRAKELLEAVGMSEHARKHPAQLSGGQQQRVAIAIALANQPKVLLADEPTGALDRQNARQVMSLIGELRERFNLSVLMVTHDMEVARYADRILTLRDGALGQDLTHSDADDLLIDAEGKVQLPQQARTKLNVAPRFAVEIRPEGVLLRPELDELEGRTTLHDIQDAPPPKRRSLFGRLLGRKPTQNGKGTS